MNYKGFTIHEEQDPWALKQGNKFRWFIDEKIHGATSVEDAKDQIDDEIIRQEYEHMNKTKSL